MSAIDYSKLRSLTARGLIKALERDGFYRKRQRGSHHRYAHADGRKVTVTFHHPGQTFRIDTLKSMIEGQARWNEEDLKLLKEGDLSRRRSNWISSYTPYGLRNFFLQAT